jgi:CheY-like chemotaxis protein
MSADRAGGTKDKSRGLVLVVDDVDGVRRLVTLLLEHAGFETYEVANGSEALAYLNASPSPDAIVLDLAMPIMGGREFLKLRETDESLLAIPVVLYSADLFISEEELRDRKVLAFVPKGDPPNRLLSAVEEAATLKKAVGER